MDEQHPTAPTSANQPDDARSGRSGEVLLPDRVGRYRVIRPIGAGGMGAVFEAEQDHPRRIVAIKLMRAGLGSESAEKRFRNEANVLARLDHPGIARVYDAGLYDDGHHPVPYFVMEFVPSARPITKHAREERLSNDDRVELMARVCDAVAHGHEQGVVHRDLKPGNILIDDSGQPKIIDFGVARATLPEGETLYTGTGQLLGTLEYMSPEQIEGDPKGVDARADVYALGMVLYELLTGEMPYKVSREVLADAARTIRETAPEAPTHHDPTLPRDLSNIVLRALHKEPARRYADASELAKDLRRYLAGEPVTARPDSAMYVIRKRAARITTRQAALCYVVAIVVAIAVSLTLNFLAPRTPVLGWAYKSSEAGLLRLNSLYAAPALDAAALDRFRVVGPTGPVHPFQLAMEFGVEGVESGNIKSLRRLHARVLERLAAARPRIVLFDYKLRDETEHDAELVRGIRALKAAGAEVVSAVPDWNLNDEGLPELSPVVLPEVRHGAILTSTPPDAPWMVEMAAQPGGLDPLPSLSLEAYAAHQHPGASATFTLDENANTVTIRYWQETDSSVGARNLVTAPEIIRLSHVVPDVGETPGGGTQAGDLIGFLFVEVPSDALLDPITSSYRDVLSATDQELRDRFADRVVAVGPLLEIEDLYEYPDGRHIHGVFTHVVAMASLFENSFLRRSSNDNVYLYLLVCSVLGLLLGRWAAGSRLLVLPAAGILLVLPVALALAAMTLWRHLINPAPLWVAELLSASAGYLIAMLRLPRR